MEENTKLNKNVVFSEAKLSDSDRYANHGWGRKVARRVMSMSGGRIKTEQQADNYLIMASIAVILIALLIALYVGK